MLLLLLWLPFQSKAYYIYLPLGSFVHHSSYAVLGTIVGLDYDYVYFAVEENVIGEMKRDTIKYSRFYNWSCGYRHEPYTIGMRQLVFLEKSNDVIEEFEYFGYGAGDEFEMPIRGDSIFFNFKYNKIQYYDLSTFVQAVREYRLLSKSYGGRSWSQQDSINYSNRSTVHASILNTDYPWGEFRIFKDLTPKYGETPTIVNAHSNILFFDFDNLIVVGGYEVNEITLIAEESVVTRTDEGFIVHPYNEENDYKRQLKVYSILDTAHRNLLIDRSFYIVPIPTPKIYFNYQFQDTINSLTSPSVGISIGKYNSEDECFQYKMLNYSITFSTEEGEKTFQNWSHQPSNSLVHYMNSSQSHLVKITVSGATVLMPNGKVVKLKDRVVYYKREEY